MALAAVGSNLITFVFGELHFPLSQAANVVTNFVGTVFILSPLGGFLSDSYAGCFWTLLAFGAVELAVRASIISSAAASLQLHPPIHRSPLIGWFVHWLMDPPLFYIPFTSS